MSDGPAWCAAPGGEVGRGSPDGGSGEGSAEAGVRRRPERAEPTATQAATSGREEEEDDDGGDAGS